MKRDRLVWLLPAVFVVGLVSALAQNSSTGSKQASHPQPDDQKDDACFKESLTGPALVDHLSALALAAPANSELSTTYRMLLDEGPFKDALSDVRESKSRLSPTFFPDIARMTQIVTDESHPMLIKNGAVVRPTPTPLAQSPGRNQTSAVSEVFEPIRAEEEPRVVKLAQSVGRLQLKDPDGPKWVGLGTAFVVAPGVIATNCHVIADYVTGDQGNWKLYWKYAQNLAVDFSDSGDYSPELSFAVTGMYAPPEEVGLDVVFLSVNDKSGNGSALPDPVRLSSRKLTPDSSVAGLKMIALVGYPSLSDLFDLKAETAYGSFKELRYNKFVVPGGITAVQSCRVPLDIILDTVSTTAGQSGSPLMDRKSGLVLGVHTCCADYFVRASDTELPFDSFPCASKRDTMNNQAISSWSIWQEPKLSRVLKDHGIEPGDSISADAH